ncbi:MAG: DUF115 domain-containing protein [Treponema sp.]|nr:DUF115 domain-containing protein [Treponema sp.]
MLSHVVEYLKRTDAGNRTTAAFGKRWVKNFLKNLENINKTLLYKQTEIPVIITGSGPNLEKAIPVIQKARENCLIIASSSSVMALSHNGIKADLVISTDGGNWALRHIYAAYRNKQTDILAVNLNAALPSQLNNTRFLIINDGSIWQNIILHELSLPSVIIPQRGTVTATAVDLAMILSSGNIYLAGMDLSVNDIRTHVKPYGFDSLFFSRANRFSPVYSQLFTRSGLLQRGKSLDIYAAWFKDQIKSWQKRIYSIEPDNKKQNIFKQGNPLEQSNLKIKKDYNIFKTSDTTINSSFSSQRGAGILIKALKENKYSEDIKKELSAFFFPGEKEVSKEILETALMKIAAKSRTKALNE